MQRQARLRTLSGLQRDALAARWQRVAPTLERIDDAVERVRRVRQHPLTLGLLALSATGLVASRRGRRLLAMLHVGWRFGLRAVTVASLWRAMRAPATVTDGPASAYGRHARVTGASAPRAWADARPAAPDDPSRSTTGAPDRRA